MKMLSYNVRSLGGGEKGKIVRRLVQQEEVQVMCIQETKKDMVDKGLCSMLWEDGDMCWVDSPLTHASMGLLCIWDIKVFQIQNQFVGRGFIGLEGVWKEMGKKL